MDPIVVAGAYLAAAIAKKVGDRALDATWDTVGERLRQLLGREVSPVDATPERIRDLASQDPIAKRALDEMGAGSRVLRRAALVHRALDGARVLWIDDEPEGNTLEIAALRSLGAEPTCVVSGTDATSALRSSSFDLIISDIARPESSFAGISDLALLRLVAPQVPVIFYVMRLEPRGVPAGAFGITARPDDLLHLCMDALERHRL